MLYTISKEKIEMEKFYLELISSMMLYKVTLKEKKKNMRRLFINFSAL